MAEHVEPVRSTPPTSTERLDPMTAMRREMDRVLDRFLGDGFGPFAMPVREAFRGAAMPRMDVRESAGEIVVEAELPGIAEKDVSVTLTDGLLRIAGEKKVEREEKKDNFHVMERSSGSFQRSFRVADTVDEGNVTARFDNGVLTVTLPKRPEAVKAERRIPIGKA